MFDSPAAIILKGSTLSVFSPDLTLLAQTPQNGQNAFPLHSDPIIENALAGHNDINDLYLVDEEGNFWLVVPLFQKDRNLPVLGILVLTIEALPGRDLIDIMKLIGLSLLAGMILLVALAPFGALFGYFISNRLTNRLNNLTTAAQAWGRGDFSVMPPVDRGNDEISTLGLQMREMAVRIHGQMQDKQTLAQMKERNRIAQELHDTVKQQSFATLMQVRAARNLLPSDQGSADQSLQEAEKLIKASQQELAVMIAELRPPAFADKGFLAALRDYVKNWSTSTSIKAEIKINDERPLPAEVEHTLYRITQEALSNVSRHSRATTLTVSLTYDEKETTLEIRDNGVGFDLSKYQVSGFGLTSMQERLKELDGRLTIRTGRGSGTTLTAILPATGPLGKRSAING